MNPADAHSPDQLNESECWRLLRLVEVGRLGLIVDGAPEILPVNFVVDSGSIVFRTASGTKLDALTAQRLVAFEADGVDPDRDVVWSVLVKGFAEPIQRLHEIVDTASLPLHPWHAGPKGHFVRVVPTSISGRRFTSVDRTKWQVPGSGDAARQQE